MIILIKLKKFMKTFGQEVKEKQTFQMTKL